MRKLGTALIVVPLAVLLVALSVVNRKPVTLGLNPFDANSVSPHGLARENGAKRRGSRRAKPQPGVAKPTASKRSWRGLTQGRDGYASPRTDPPLAALRNKCCTAMDLGPQIA